jgi:HK97 family phage major capsid protein
MPKVDEFRAIVKTVMGVDRTAEERAAVTTADNAAVLPKQFVDNVIELQKGYGSLKDICDIIPVFKNEGTIPVVDLDQNEMLDVVEGADIVDGTLVTTDTPFTVSKVGLIQTLTSELIDDAEGVSLERIDPDAMSQKESNWHSAASTAGSSNALMKSKCRRIGGTLMPAIRVPE